jgi:membrane-associated HD superfamily phosphohydrolase
LHNVFGKIKDNSEEREERNLEIFKSLSEVIMKDHEQTLKEVHEQEILQDKKIKLLDQVQEQRSGRNRLIAIPGVIIAITGIIYMFYVVSIMETAMTNMSQNMNKIQLSVAGMGDKIGTISEDTTAMSSNMQQLNGNTLQMSRDLNVMTNNVGPAMKGMRDVMPWAP